MDSFWHDIEGYRWDTVRGLQVEFLRTQLEYVYENSPFYRDKFEEGGLSPQDVRSLEDLNRLPFTTKDELRQSLETAPLGSHRGASWDRITRVSSSSGTTGRPTYYGVSSEDREMIWDTWAQVYYATGVRPGDRTIYCFAMGGPFGGLYGSEGLEYMGCSNIPVGAEQSSERILQLIQDLQPNVLVSVTNFPVYLAERADDLLDTTVADLSVDQIVVGGEPVVGLRSQIEQLWQADVREMMGMGEFGMIWGECEHERGMHYLARQDMLVQIMDPDTEEVFPFQDGTEGELIYTALNRETSPLVRFRTRDYVTVEAMGCPCGRTGPLIRCVGRTDDMVKVKGVNVFPSAIEDVLSDFQPEVTGEFRIVLESEERKFSRPLPLKVEVDAQSVQDRDGLKERLAGTIRNRLTVSPDITLVNRGELGRQTRGGLDRRDVFEYAF